MRRNGVVIAGGGLAAQRCCETLRTAGYDGRIVMVCAEDRPPYDRPPLSKELLAGTRTPDTLGFRSAEWYDDAGVELRLGVAARRLDRATRTLELHGGERLVYDRLLVATGARPRRLTALDGYDNVLALRDADDAHRLRKFLDPGAQLAVVGAGFIGLEVASTARALGAKVTVVEALQTPLAGVLGPLPGRRLATLHGRHDVAVLGGSRIVAVRGGRRAEELVLDGGPRVACDVVVTGVGVEPATDWLAGSGLDPAGVRTDPAGRTPFPAVFAAGDAALAFDPFESRHVGGAHWDGAARQGAAAARAMLGLDPGPPPVPSFWSDQHGLRIHGVGRPRPSDAVHLDGDLAAGDFEATFGRGGRLVAAVTVGRPRALAAARREIAALTQLVPESEEHAA